MKANRGPKAPAKNTVTNVAEKVADSVSHKLHSLIEQYANLFKNGARTPVFEATERLWNGVRRRVLSIARRCPPGSMVHTGRFLQAADHQSPDDV
jgi:hypothetical protein